MTEIPEHLLKRSQAAKAKATGGEAPADAPAAAATPAVPAAAAPAAAAKAAAPAKPAAPAPKPDIPVVTAYKERKKIPVWAMLTLSILPVWGFMYVRALTPQKAEAVGPLAAGASVYSAGGCASCHGTGGEGGAGRQLSQGMVLTTFPHIEDQLNLVYTGSQAYADNGFASYGDPSVGHLKYNGAYMPAFGATLSELEILEVVCHERYDLGGADLTGEWAAEYALWCAADAPIYLAIEAGTADFSNVHEQFAAEGVLPIGTEPRAGTAAG
ncbi:MAG: c-type cytochrome [Acidimicrobiaceae bacterium]|nr:c-type cytochrome [Ilumatobacter sp.]MCB9382748.1 c-type cytochrome [Acidimicrobiaceae bacterium]MCO5331758.1 c-type cytochrome [Ilumatobacteraceae bacterium]